MTQTTTGTERKIRHPLWSCVMHYPGQNSKIFRMALLTVQKGSQFYTMASEVVITRVGSYEVITVKCEPKLHVVLPAVQIILEGKAKCHRH
jgi:hypothetical protein